MSVSECCADVRMRARGAVSGVNCGVGETGPPVTCARSAARLEAPGTGRNRHDPEGRSLTDDSDPGLRADPFAEPQSSLYRRVMDSARDVVFVVDAAGRIVEANRAAETTYGYARDTLIGMALSDLRALDSLPTMQDQLSAAGRGGVLFETEHRRADGTIFPVEVSSRGLDLDGRQMLVSIVRDITDRHERDSESQRLVSELASANGRLDALVRIMSGVLGTLDVDELLRQTLGLLLEETGADAALLLEADAEGLLGRTEAGAVAWGGVGLRLAIGEGFSGRVAAAGSPLYVPDVLASDFSIDIHVASGFRSMFGVPMYLAGELYGVLELAWCEERVVDDAEMSLVQAAAERVMLAVANAKLFTRTKRAEALSAALNDVNSLVNSSFDLSDTMGTALEVSAKALEADVVVLAVNDDGVWRTHGVYGADLCDRPLDYEHWIANELLQPISSPAPSTPMYAWLEANLGVRESLALRLSVHGRQVGLLLFGRHVPRGGFDEMERDVAERFAGAIALAMANVAEFENEHRIAERLQEALLTTPSSVRGIEFAHLYRSATVSTRVGGDFYDLFELAHGRVGVVIGDVSGKGLEAAVLTSVIKDTIRALAHDIESPAEVMSRANLVLLRAARLPEFASVFFAVIDTRSASMTYCSAGHPPAAVLTAEGAVHLLDCSSAVIGAIEDVEYIERTTVLDHGEMVFLYTDGVTEARRQDGTFFGEGRLVRQLCSSELVDIRGVPVRVFDAVMEFTQGRLTDDIALLAFQLA